MPACCGACRRRGGTLGREVGVGEVIGGRLRRLAVEAVLILPALHQTMHMRSVDFSMGCKTLGKGSERAEQTLRTLHARHQESGMTHNTTSYCDGCQSIVQFTGMVAIHSRALEADLAAATGQLGSRALAGDGACILALPRAGLGRRDGVQAVRKGV